jgi:hypothetical protein
MLPLKKYDDFIPRHTPRIKWLQGNLVQGKGDQREYALQVQKFAAYNSDSGLLSLTAVPLVPYSQSSHEVGFENFLMKYSNHLNTGLVWYSDSCFVS